ncbi:hypothetical protein DYB37_010900 [Aphanomyces astaci]|uniref:DUF6818 domain-containing protein n=1 Tax=Aphanomyces astaci TaxID=112090 RepID=A0A3R7BYE5_APHAT|nr:hypothetical protein DYB37_010900 [Aphanomyces astaci]
MLPLGKNGWEKVESRFNRLTETKLLAVRDVDVLKRKFILLKNHAKPTGDPECPVEVKRAKRIQREIDQSVLVMPLDGGGDEDENDDGKKSYLWTSGRQSEKKAGLSVKKSTTGSAKSVMRDMKNYTFF